MFLKYKKKITICICIILILIIIFIWKINKSTNEPFDVWSDMFAPFVAAQKVAAAAVAVDKAAAEAAAKVAVVEADKDLYTYTGCFKDKDANFPNNASIGSTEGRALPNFLNANTWNYGSNPISVHECYIMANARNYDLFGLQANGSCWAGNINDRIINPNAISGKTLVRPRYSMYGKITDSECGPGTGYTNQIYTIIPPSITVKSITMPSINMNLNNTNAYLTINNNSYNIINPDDYYRRYSSTATNNGILNYDKSMLDTNQGWSASDTKNIDPISKIAKLDGQDWLQIELGNSPISVSGVVIQGRGDQYKQIITSYNISYSNENILWNLLKDSSNKIINITINVIDYIINGTNYFVYVFPNPINTKYIRIIPKSSYEFTSARAGILKLMPPPTTTQPTTTKPIPTTTYTPPIPTIPFSYIIQNINVINLTNILNSKYNSEYQLLSTLKPPNNCIRTYSASNPAVVDYNISTINSKIGWVAPSNTGNEYIKMDIGSSIDIKGVVTQGSGQNTDCVTQYKILYSNDNVKWFLINNTAKNPNTQIMTGNSSTLPNQLVYNIFDTLINAQYIVIYVVSYVGNTTIRADILIPIPSPKFDTHKNYTYNGCYIDKSDNSQGNALTNKLNNVSGKTGVYDCYNIANTNQYDFFGLKNGDECWAGFNKNNSSDIKTLFTPQTDLTKCVNMLGDESTNKVYNINDPIPKSPNFKYKGCYNKTEQAKVQPDYIGKVTNTIDCYNAAQINNNTFGISNNGNCWSGQTTDNYSQYNSADDCDILGNETKIQIYEINKAPIVTYPNPFVTSPNYDYKGCYFNENTNINSNSTSDINTIQYALSKYYDNQTVSSVNECYDLASSEYDSPSSQYKYDLIGLQNDGECWAGNKKDPISYNNYGIADSCKLLGSPNANQIYEIKNRPITTSAPTNENPYNTQAPYTIPYSTTSLNDSLSGIDLSAEISRNLSDARAQISIIP